MRPIVDGLSEEVDGRAAFVYLNARDGAAGEQLFESLSLLGHPAILIFDPAGIERFRAYGVVDDQRLRLALDEVLESKSGTP